MSLLSNSGPPRPNTHPLIAPDTLIALAKKIKEDIGLKVGFDELMQFAEKTQSPVEQVLAAIAYEPQFQWEVEYESLLAVCVGQCQLQGAFDNLKVLIAKKKAGAKIEIIPRTCLDMCAHSPVAISRSSHGQAAHPKLTPQQIDEILTVLN